MIRGSVEMRKKQLRQKFAAARKEFTADGKDVFDAAIVEQIRSLPIYRSSENIAGFISFGAEPDISGLFRGKRLFLPRFNMREGVYEMVAVENFKHDLLPGKYGIPEPSSALPTADRDLLVSQVLFLVPAVACDLCGCRLGRGGGYYDRLLSGVKTPPIAVIYSCQLSETALPGTEHDIRMGMIATDREIIDVAEKKRIRREKS